MKSLEERLHSATVISPVDGTFYSLPVHQGDYVKVGDLLAEIADLRHVRVRAFVDEPDLGRLAPGQEVQATWDAKPGRVWSGRTELIPNRLWRTECGASAKFFARSITQSLSYYRT